MQIQSAGLPWFYEDDYESFRRILPERRWHPTYGEWLQAAEQTLQHESAKGRIALKAYVRSHEFVAWCRERGLDVESRALTTFAAEFAALKAYNSERH